MRKYPGLELIKIENENYLLPFGQAICDHKRGMRINETAALIWSLLDDVRDKEGLINACLEETGLSGNEAYEAASDIGGFIDSLVKAGIILEEEATSSVQSSDPDSHSESEDFFCSGTESFSCTGSAEPLRLSIAGLRIDLYCDPEDIDRKLLDFKAEGADPAPDQIIYVTYSEAPADVTGTLFITTCEMDFRGHGDHYAISYNEASPVRQVRLSADGSRAVIYAVKAPDLIFHLFHALRLPFLYLAEKNKKYAIHSASILYKDRAWLFSASAGTGKSTHAALWHDLLDTPHINGDLNLIGTENGEPFIWGIPWCGTSEIYDRLKHRLGGVIFLKRSKNDSAEKLDPVSGLVTLSRRTISPVWTSESLRQMMEDLSPLSNLIYLGRLYCTKEASAQKTLQESIDSYLSR